MAELVFPGRYVTMRRPESGATHEANYRLVEETLKLKVEETALVMIDVWDVSEVREKYGWVPGLTDSFLQRDDKIVVEKIKPALDISRKVGLCIIHAPSSYIAIRYPQHERLAKRLDLPRTPDRTTDWPPTEFIMNLRTRDYERQYGEGTIELDRFRQSTSTIPEIVGPTDEEDVISSGEQMDCIFKEGGIVNLIYVGFATNMCLMLKPGGIHDMYYRGYKIVLLRDCTMGIENARSLPGLTQTETYIQAVEMTWGFTTTSEEFIKACKGAMP